MWNMDFEPPLVIEATMLSKMPNKLRRPVGDDWENQARMQPEIQPVDPWEDPSGQARVVNCSLEGAAFDRAGNLYMSDTPSGRILRLSRAGQWQEVAHTGGWPQGIAVHQDGALWVADAQRGLLRVAPDTGAVHEQLGRNGAQVNLGAKDLVFDGQGNCYFTAPGHSGMHDPTGKVFRLGGDGRLDLLLSNLPGPSGNVLDRDAKKLFVAVDRGNPRRPPKLPH